MYFSGFSPFPLVPYGITSIHTSSVISVTFFQCWRAKDMVYITSLSPLPGPFYISFDLTLVKLRCHLKDFKATRAHHFSPVLSLPLVHSATGGPLHWWAYHCAGFHGVILGCQVHIVILGFYTHIDLHTNFSHIDLQCSHANLSSWDYTFLYELACLY